MVLIFWYFLRISSSLNRSIEVFLRSVDLDMAFDSRHGHWRRRRQSVTSQGRKAWSDLPIAHKDRFPIVTRGTVIGLSPIIHYCNNYRIGKKKHQHLPVIGVTPQFRNFPSFPREDGTSHGCGGDPPGAASSHCGTIQPPGRGKIHGIHLQLRDIFWPAIMTSIAMENQHL